MKMIKKNVDQYDDDAEGQDEVQGTGGGKKKKRRLVKKKKSKQGFDLNGIHHLGQNEYNALKDAHLQSFFVNERVRKHLRVQN